MAEYSVSTIKPSDIKSLNAVDEILRSQNLKRDNGLDCIAVVRNEEYEIVATGSALGNTLRCFAVKDECKGEGILNLLVTYLVDVQIQRGNSDIFLYTKPSSSEFFRSLGFHEIAKVENKLVFMENKSNLFNSFLDGLSCYKKDKRSGCIVMNANPFTKGHRYLVEQALKDCDVLHVFIVSEDKSEIPFSVRKKLVEAGLSDLKNVIIHNSGSYIISNATFPSYFLENDEDVMTVHASLDANIFVKIASAIYGIWIFLKLCRITVVFIFPLISEHSLNDIFIVDLYILAIKEKKETHMKKSIQTKLLSFRETQSD